jgi:hypothetical protein
VRVVHRRIGHNRAVGGDPLVGPHLLLQFANGDLQGEAGIGAGLHHGLFLGSAAESDGGEAEEAQSDDGEQDKQGHGNHQGEGLGVPGTGKWGFHRKRLDVLTK